MRCWRNQSLDALVARGFLNQSSIVADEQMVRRLLLSFATLAAAMFVAATPAWANDSGNFHLMAGGELACHWGVVRQCGNGVGHFQA